MIFVKATLVGGYTDLRALIESGELGKMLGTQGRKSKRGG
jgi:hypothetical protein